jgi:hypothetical protein
LLLLLLVIITITKQQESTHRGQPLLRDSFKGWRTVMLHSRRWAARTQCVHSSWARARVRFCLIDHLLEWAQVCVCVCVCVCVSVCVCVCHCV